MVLIADGKRYNSIDEYMEDREKKGIKVTVSLYDAINEKECGTATAVLEETAVLSQSNLLLPEGYSLYSTKDSSIVNPTVIIENGKATEQNYEVKIFKRNKNGNIIIENITGFNKIPSDLTEKYVLANDIDLSANSLWNPIGWIDDNECEFTGEFDGAGYNITGLKCDYSSYSASNVGLFAKNAGTIKNLNVITSAVYGESNIGIIAGDNKTGGVIENCHVSGPVKSTGDSGGGGGIAGGNSGTIRLCSVKSLIVGYFWTGGITGKNFGTIDQSFFVGGINSNLTDNTIINIDIRYIGGIAGGTTGTISNSYAILTNYLKGYAGVGGIAGWNSGDTAENVYCAGTGKVYGGEYYKVDFGFTRTNPILHSGVLTSKTTSTGLTSIPSAFSSELWDMNGKAYPTCPNLINNPN